MRRSLTLALLLALVLSVPTAAAAGSARLLGRAVLPARTFAPGPPSGTLLGSAPINGVRVPFAHQPVQGIAAALPARHGRYWVMMDNGYGALENSADFNLRVYLIKPHYKTASGGSGRVSVLRFIQLHDPDKKLKDRTVTLDTGEVTFWEAFDQFFDRLRSDHLQRCLIVVAGGMLRLVGIGL